MKKDKKKKLRKKFRVRPTPLPRSMEEAQPDFPALNETSPLSEAVCAGDPGRVLGLLDGEADPNERVGTRQASDSPLNLAVTKAQSAEVLRLLLERGADPSHSFHLACCSDGKACRRSPLSEAIGAQNAEMVRLLLEHDADPNFPDLGFTREGEPMRTSMLSRAVEQGNAEILRLLLEHGADPNRATRTVCAGGHPHRRTVLSEAAVTYGNRELVRLLLEHGADPNGYNVGFCEDGRAMEESVLNQLVRSNGSPEILRLLLEKGADPNASYRLWAGEQGSVYYTPLYDAMERGRESEQVQLLRQFGGYLMTAKEDEA